MSQNKIVLWIKKDGVTRRYHAPYEAKIYVRSKDNDGAYRKLVENRYNAQRIAFMDLISDSIVDGIEVKTDEINHMKRFTRDLERLGVFEWRIYNADLSADQMYLFDNKINPLSQIEYSERNGEILNITKHSDVEEPELKKCFIEVFGEYNPERDFECKIRGIKLDDIKIDGDEETILKSFKKEYLRADPDIVLVEKGDKYAIDYIKYRFLKNNIGFEFGRDKDVFSNWSGKSFWSYGSVIRRNPAHYLRGRFHIDTSSFLYYESGLEGIFELSRICGTPIQRAARLSPGASITNLYLYTAYSLGYPVPYKINMVEDFKTAKGLLASDKGGMIYEPVTGFHTDTFEIDFVSLYPHIMVNWNLSPETILCRCCGENITVPFCRYNVCQKRRGIIPKVLAPVLQRRIELKRLYRQTGEDKYKAMSNALKWILVTSFGYMGYRKSRFARIEAHESITSIARHVLMQSTELAQEDGYRVLHGIVDSLWLQKKNIDKSDALEICKKIEGKFNIPIEIEGFYKWIVFNPSVNSPIAPAPNRYYGVFDDGQIKVRGIEMRRRDAPVMIKKFQEDCLLILSKSENRDEFLTLIPETIRVLTSYRKKLSRGDFEPLDIAIRKRITRPVEKYKCSNAQKIVLDNLREMGYEKEPGENIQYIMRNSSARNPRKRYVPVEGFDGIIDFVKYTELLVRALENLLIPFGYTDEVIFRKMESQTQKNITSFF